MATPQNSQSPPEQGPWNKYASSPNGSSSDSQPWTKYASSSDQAPWLKYSAQPATATQSTYHSNPAFSNYASPDDPSRYSSKSPQAQTQSDLVAPAKDKPIPKPVQYAMEAAPFLESGVAAI